MRNVLLLALLALMAFIFVFRVRIYVRDPVGTVYRDNAKQSGVQVYFNYLNDILLIKDSDPGGYRILVQNWDRTPGAPVRLICLPWSACLTEADTAPILPMAFHGKGTYDPKVTMSNREVSFVDGDGVNVRVQLK